MNLSSSFVPVYSIRRVNITSRNKTAYTLFSLSSVSDGGMRRIKRGEREREKNEHSYKVVCPFADAVRRRRSTFIIDTFLLYTCMNIFM